MGPDLLKKRRPTLRIPRDSYEHLLAERNRYRELATQRAIKIAELETLLRAARMHRKPHTW